MPSYKVLQEAEVLGEKRAVGDVIEVDVETGAPLVDAGVLEVVPEGGTSTPAQPATPTPPNGGTSVPPPTAPASNDAKDEIATPGSTAPAAPKGEEKKEGWVGGHTVSGNEPNPNKGGSVTQRHPDLEPKK